MTLALALTVPVTTLMLAAEMKKAADGAPPRPAGPGDVYAAAGTPCVAAHSSTRALFAAYNGPLYQVMRQSDGKTLDIGVVQPSATPVPDAGGYADAAAQDAFCANTTCWVTVLYDQSGHHNDLRQAPRGAFSGPAMGGANNLPLADLAPVTVMGHKVYGVFIAPGMGLRLNDATGTAVDDQAEGQYWVVNGHHYNAGCCFDYGNAETDSRDNGNGTMETAYYGTAGAWYRGSGSGPWVMTDQENNLVGCVNADGSKGCPDLPSISWRFVTAMADGEPHHWRSMGGDAQQGALQVMFDGPRVNRTYDPMRKEGAILLGNGGDNSNGSQGTFYEGAMTAAGTFPSKDINQKIQANVVAAGYNVAPVAVGRAATLKAPPGLQTFAPGATQETTVTFTNPTGVPVQGVKLGLSVPHGWTAVLADGGGAEKTFRDAVAPGAEVSATFKVTAGSEPCNGDLVGQATWTRSATGGSESATGREKVRGVLPIKINEFRLSAGLRDNPTNSFIELYNAGDAAVDLSRWSLTLRPVHLPVFSSIVIPAGTQLAPKGYYLLALANSGLAAPAAKGQAVIHVRTTAGMKVGDTVQIGSGSDAETRTITAIGTAAGESTTVWQPLPEGPVITIPAGATAVPVTTVAGFEVGQKIGLGYDATYPTVSCEQEKYEVVTVTAVGKPGTQAWLAADAKPGDTNLKVSSVDAISVGDKIRLDIASVGHGIETVTVTKVGTASKQNPRAGHVEDPGTGIEVAEPLKFAHAANMPFSVNGTGLRFEPAARFAHASNEPVQPLGTGLTLDRPLDTDHGIDAVVRDAAVTTAGYHESATPNQWFGGPALAIAGNMVLRDGSGLVVDSLNYGAVVDPWANEGFQAVSGPGMNFVPTPEMGRSAGRFPDGADNDHNRGDFVLQAATDLPLGAAAGDTVIKVGTVGGFVAGQTLTIGDGGERETAVIGRVGTGGSSTVRTATAAGATTLRVTSSIGVTVGQTLTIGRDDTRETAVVAAVNPGRRGPVGPTVTFSAPLKKPHAVGTPVSGSGITLTHPLTHAHAADALVTNNVPTPGGPNRYYADRR